MDSANDRRCIQRTDLDLQPLQRALTRLCHMTQYGTAAMPQLRGPDSAVGCQHETVVTDVHDLDVTGQRFRQDLGKLLLQYLQCKGVLYKPPRRPFAVA